MSLRFFVWILLGGSALGRMAPEVLDQMQLEQEHMEIQMEDDDAPIMWDTPALPPGFDTPLHPTAPVLPTNLLGLFDAVYDSDEDAPVPHHMPPDAMSGLPAWLSQESPTVITPSGHVMGLAQLHDVWSSVPHVALHPLYMSIMRRLLTSSMGDFCEYMATLLPSLINLIYGNTLPSVDTGYNLSLNAVTMLFHHIFNIGMFPDSPIMDYNMMVSYGVQTFQSYVQIYNSPFVSYQHPTDLLFYGCPWVSPANVASFIGMMQPLMVHVSNDMVHALAIGALDAVGVLEQNQNPLLALFGQPFDANAYINDVIFIHHNSALSFDFSVIHLNDQIMHPSVPLPLNQIHASILPVDVAPASPNIHDSAFSSIAGGSGM